MINFNMLQNMYNSVHNALFTPVVNIPDAPPPPLRPYRPIVQRDNGTRDRIRNKKIAILKLFAKNGNLAIVRNFIKDTNIRESAWAEVLMEACRHGHLEIAKEIVCSKEIDYTLFTAFKEGTIEHGYASIICRNKIPKATFERKYELVALAVHNEHFEMLKMLLNKLFYISIDSILSDIPTHLQTDALKQFIENPISRLIIAAEDGEIALFDFLLPLSDYSKLTVNDNEALRLAAQNGHKWIVRSLLGISSVREQATALSNFALCMAAQNGYFEIVADLLAIPAVREELGCNNYAQWIASQNDQRGTAADLTSVQQYELSKKLIKTFSSFTIEVKSETLKNIVNNALNDSETLPKHNDGVLKAFKAQKRNQEASKENLTLEGKAARSSLKRKVKCNL